MTTAGDSLHDQLGGDNLDLGAFTDDLFDRIRRDPLLALWFDKVPLGTHEVAFAEWLGVALRGEPWTGRSLRDTHRMLSLGTRTPGDPEFDAVGRHVRDTLAAYGAPGNVVENVLGGLEAERDEVLNREPRPS